MRRTGRHILWLIEALLGTTLLVSVLLICANAFGRYVLYRPIIWAEEVLGYALVWMVYLGAIIVTNKNEHLRMDLLAQLLSKKVQSVLRLLGNLVFIATGLLIIYQAPGSISEFKHHSQVANLPMDVVHTIIPVSFAAMVILVVFLSIDEIRYLARGADATNSEKAT